MLAALSLRGHLFDLYPPLRPDRLFEMSVLVSEALLGLTPPVLCGMSIQYIHVQTKSSWVYRTHIDEIYRKLCIYFQWLVCCSGTTANYTVIGDMAEFRIAFKNIAILILYRRALLFVWAVTKT